MKMGTDWPVNSPMYLSSLAAGGFSGLRWVAGKRETGLQVPAFRLSSLDLPFPRVWGYIPPV
jgi:hypothetical protein